MDQRERLDDVEEALRIAIDGRLARLWTAIPCTVVSYDASTLTCVLQPTIQAKFTAQDGSLSDITLPNLLDCPVVFPSCAFGLLTFPLAAGDEGLAIFSSRCIDNWWAQGVGASSPARPQFEMRMHDLSDGFFVPGVYSKPNVPPAVSATAVQLRNKAGTVRIEIAANNTINLVATSSINLVSPIGLSILGGPLIKRILFGTATTAFTGSLAAGTFQISTMPVSGAKVGDMVFISRSNFPGFLAVVSAYIAADNVVTIQVNNPSASPIALPSLTYMAMVVGLT